MLEIKKQSLSETFSIYFDRSYELFLDEKGEKISKSKGNGITIDQWLEYASPESLSLYMYQNPKRAKKLYKEIVPKAVDEYLDCIEKSKNQNELQLLMNPVWHVHNGKIPKEEMIMTFSMLLNLVETSNADSKDLLWKFVKKYKSDYKNTKPKIPRAIENPFFLKKLMIGPPSVPLIQATMVVIKFCFPSFF